MSEPTDEELQSFGANARARGESLTSCPYYRRTNAPVATGESIDEWNRKTSNWEFGWKMENAIRELP